jgi:hypothetical protein
VQGDQVTSDEEEVEELEEQDNDLDEMGVEQVENEGSGASRQRLSRVLHPHTHPTHIQKCLLVLSEFSIM